MTHKHISDAQHVRDVRSLQPTRGVSSQQFRGCQSFVRRFPDRAEEVLEALGPHMFKLGQTPFARMTEELARLRPDLLASWIQSVEPDEHGLLLLRKVASQGQGQPDLFWMCRSRMEQGNVVDLRAFDARCGRQGVIHVFHGMTTDSSFALLDAVLSLPHAAELTMEVQKVELDWAATVIAQTLEQTPRPEQVRTVLERLMKAGIALQAPGKHCQALEVAVVAWSGFTDRAKENVNTLLELGAEVQGLEQALAGMRQNSRHKQSVHELLEYVDRHPIVRARRLDRVACGVRGDAPETVERKRRAM